MEQSFDITSARAGNNFCDRSVTTSSGLSSGGSSCFGGGMSSALSAAHAKGTVASIQGLVETLKALLTKTGKFTFHKETGAVWKEIVLM